MSRPDSSIDNDQPRTRRGKSRLTGCILAVAVTCVMVFANLPYEYVETDNRWMGSMELDALTQFNHQLRTPTMAGWPLRYLTDYEFDGTHQNRYWSLPRLLINAALGLFLAICVYGFIQLRSRMIDGRRSGRRVRLMFDVTAALIILAVPGALVLRAHLITQQHLQLSRQLTRYGNVNTSCMLPKPLVDYVPSGMMTQLHRIRRVRVYRFRGNTEIENRVAEVPTLVGLQVYRDGIGVDSIRRLKSNLHFAELQLARYELDDADVKAIGDLPWLQDLGLSGTNVDQGMLRRFDHLSLTFADFSNTEIKLSELGKPGWSQTVVELVLSRPGRGQSDSLVIHDWPKLRALTVTRATDQQNPEPLTIDLHNLPSLELVRLNRLQKHRFVLRDLPRLSTIDDGVGELRFLLDSMALMPGLPWISELTIDGAPSMIELECFARDLEALSLSNVPNLRSVTMGSFLARILGENIPQPADPRKCQQWIEYFGNREGPGTVDLSWLPLTGIDLTPLTRNQRIRRLNFNSSGVDFDQIASLEPMKQLEALNIRTCRLQDDQLSWLLQRFDQMEFLVIDGRNLRSLSLQEGLKLRELHTTPLQQLDELRMVDVPSLRTYLRLEQSPQVLEIRNAKSLRGLAVEQPWPSGAIVEGLRDLQWFSGGGPEVDDDLMEVLLDCGQIDQLTIAYGSLSRERLKDIGSFRELTMLILPGADLDDEVTKHWTGVDSLWEVNFNDTRVSVGTLAWLKKHRSLRRVSLNRVPLNEAALNALGQLTQVSELRLADVSIPLLKLEPILAEGNVESLDLSGTPVDEQMLDFVRRAHSLQQLIVHRSEVDPEVLKQIIDANESLYVDLGEIPDSIDDDLARELQRRGHLVRDRFIRGWQSSFRVVDGYINPREPIRPPVPDDLDQFPRRVVTLSMPMAGGRIDDTVFRTAE